MKTAKEYRMQAKEALSGQWGMAIVTTVLYGLIVSALSSTGIGNLILGGALTCGYSALMCGIFRGRRIEVGALFDGFNVPRFSATIGLWVKTGIFVMLWSCLFLIPGIIKAYSYSMASYILMDHPEMTGGEAITASKELMVGKKWKLFCLEISYLGWILLCCLTMGILTFWVAPWMKAAEAAFYEDIKFEVPGTASGNDTYTPPVNNGNYTMPASGFSAPLYDGSVPEAPKTDYPEF